MKQTTYAEYPYPHAVSGVKDTLGRLVAAARSQLRIWKHRSETRDALARLSQRELEDIGITETARRIEIDKPFWEA
jgi:uncharacterized protein YjiS (DUF1127 family)